MARRARLTKTIAVAALGYLASLALASCEFDSGSRWFASAPVPAPAPECTLDDLRCAGSNGTGVLQRCMTADDGVARWQVSEDCAANGQVCAASLEACVNCLPDRTFCEGLTVRQCDSVGDQSTLVKTCDASAGQACRTGSCENLCLVAQEERSNVGCEYWPVDLDNAMINLTRNASAQQYAVVVSNPQPDVAVAVTITQDDSQPGEPHDPQVIAEAVIAPLNLRVFKLGPREVDGSPEGEFNTGTHTALTRQAYRVTSDFPVVAYQFNPLENVNVFSNDASLLKPREALSYNNNDLALNYVVVGWPQTIANTDNPSTNFSAGSPINLRSFLTIVATRDKTRIRVVPTTAVLGSPNIPFTPSGVPLELDIDAYDVVNLETPSLNAFGADFTGTTIFANAPVAVFSGGEASDAPNFDSLIARRCCADHLEEQLDPVRSAGTHFAMAHSAVRTKAVVQAGADIGITEEEPEFFRFVATSDGVTTVETTLPPPNNRFQLSGIGRWRELTSTHDFLVASDKPMHAVQVMASQAAANVPRGLPGGDPSMLIVPPQEQYRADYVFLTPDKYAFDFVAIVAPANAEVALDDVLLNAQACEIRPTDGLDEEQRGGPPEWLTYMCQLSFPTIDPDTDTLSPGTQNDGVHRVVGSQPIGVTVFGFDSFVSYAYAAGTELRELAIPR